MLPEGDSLNIDDIHVELSHCPRCANEYNPNSDRMRALMESIASDGQDEEVHVRRATDIEKALTGRRYVLIAFGGARRLVAIRAIHKPGQHGVYIKAMIHDSTPDYPKSVE